MSKKRTTSGDLQRFWQDTINKWRKSSLSVRQFCKDRGLSNSSFYGGTVCRLYDGLAYTSLHGCATSNV